MFNYIGLVLIKFGWIVFIVCMMSFKSLNVEGGEYVDFGVCRLKVFGVVIYKLLLKKKLVLMNNMDD